MNEHEVIGYTTADLVEAMGAAGIHCSLDRFRRLAHQIQARALAEKARRDLALNKMTAENERLDLYLTQEEK